MKTRTHAGAPKAVVICLAACILLWCCGKKEPPRPPSRLKPPAVKDLSHRIEGNRVKLSWRIPRKENRNQADITGFRVYESKIPLSESDCRNCPIQFKRFDDVSVLNTGRKAQFHAERTLEPGYRYIFTVRGVSDNYMLSKDSNYIDIDFD